MQRKQSDSPTDTTTEPDTRGIGRRRLLQGAGVVTAGGLLAPALGGVASAATPAPTAGLTLLTSPSGGPTVQVDGLHITFGADAARSMTVSWTTRQSVPRPRVLVGSPAGGFGRSVDAETRTYTDSLSGREVQTHHVQLTGLKPATDYIYAAVHDGGRPEIGAFRTAPAGRKAFRFTSFGDQATPYLTAVTPPATGPLPAGTVLPVQENDALGHFAAGDVVEAVESLSPTFHLINGDLCYANLAADRLRVWNGFFDNNTRSARWRPWMPTVGNHENEANGPIGFSAYQSRFVLPDNGEEPAFQGLWYAFTVGAVRVICINNDDVCFQDAGSRYVHGYSGGAQRKWLQRELAAARLSRDIDWIVVCMHQVVISTADANGADLGIRQEFEPLFELYGVDLVVCGHEHHYERSLAVRGVVSGSETLTPQPVSAETSVIDTSKGTVHMVIGGGGTNAPSNGEFFADRHCKVITGVGPVGANGKRPPIYVTEPSPWSAYHDPDHAHGFVSFDVDPGTTPGGTTKIQATYWATTGPGTYEEIETFTLERPRADG